jgi:hypothetical protein
MVDFHLNFNHPALLEDEFYICNSNLLKHYYSYTLLYNSSKKSPPTISSSEVLDQQLQGSLIEFYIRRSTNLSNLLKNSSANFTNSIGFSDGRFE